MTNQQQLEERIASLLRSDELDSLDVRESRLESFSISIPRLFYGN